MSRVNGVSIREVYGILTDFRKENNEGHDKINGRIDNLEENHLSHINNRIQNIENKLYFAAGGLAVLQVIIYFVIKFVK